VQLLTTQAAAEANVTVTSSIVGSDTVDESTVLASVNALENKVNALLAKLRTHGIIAT
jgi:phage shock protein A